MVKKPKSLLRFLKQTLMAILFLSLNLPVSSLCQESSSPPFYVINDIIIEGNITTKKHIIYRELLFSIGDTIYEENMQETFKRSKENLLNTFLFNFVTIDTMTTGQNKLNIQINLKERWYTWPFPIFELADRNFNVWWETKDFARTNYGFYLTKFNFRGRKETLTLNLRFGYDQQYLIAYNMPYLNSKQTIGTGLMAGYSQNHEIAYKTTESRQAFYKDPDKNVRESYFGRINYTNRQGFYNKHTVFAQYNYSIDRKSVV